jgi:hypothetical protein
LAADLGKAGQRNTRKVAQSRKAGSPAKIGRPAKSPRVEQRADGSAMRLKTRVPSEEPAASPGKIGDGD